MDADVNMGILRDLILVIINIGTNPIHLLNLIKYHINQDKNISKTNSAAEFLKSELNGRKAKKLRSF